MKWPYSIPIKITDISEKGFNIHLRGKVYYLLREEYPWFLGATDEEILDVDATPGFPDDPEYRGDWICWETLDVDIGSHSFEFPNSYPVVLFSKQQIVRLEKYRREMNKKG